MFSFSGSLATGAGGVVSLRAAEAPLRTAEAAFGANSVTGYLASGLGSGSGGRLGVTAGCADGSGRGLGVRFELTTTSEAS